MVSDAASPSSKVATTVRLSMTEPAASATVAVTVSRPLTDGRTSARRAVTAVPCEPSSNMIVAGLVTPSPTMTSNAKRVWMVGAALSSVCMTPWRLDPTRSTSASAFITSLWMLAELSMATSPLVSTTRSLTSLTVVTAARFTDASRRIDVSLLQWSDTSMFASGADTTRAFPASSPYPPRDNALMSTSLKTE